MYSYLDDAILEGLILESAIATPYNVEENIKRGEMAMRHVIMTHGKEYHAMYRKKLGWIAFSWGEPGTPPPEFKNRKEAAEWWANLPGKTNTEKGSHVFAKGRGVSHIIAKRDWEGKWMNYLLGQNGVDVAMKCVEMIAKGRILPQRSGKLILYDNMQITLIRDNNWVESKELRAYGKKKEEFWILTGFEIVNDKNYGIFESADVHGSATHQNEGMPTALRLSSRTLKGEPPMSTHVRPIVSPPHMGATNSNYFLSTSLEDVNIGWLLDL